MYVPCVPCNISFICESFCASASSDYWGNELASSMASLQAREFMSKKANMLLFLLLFPSTSLPPNPQRTNKNSTHRPRQTFHPPQLLKQTPRIPCQISNNLLFIPRKQKRHCERRRHHKRAKVRRRSAGRGKTKVLHGGDVFIYREISKEKTERSVV